MILTNRLFTRRPPSRDAKSIYIFCEGVKREYEYFLYFKEIDSRINIEVYPLKHDEDNSPSGLFKITSECILKTDDNPDPKFELIKGDEVWIVFDTDLDKLESRKEQINELRKKCQDLKWFVAQSNPCFEVWLYYHFLDNRPKFEGDSYCKGWKPLLDSFGGFDPRKHPIFIEKAIKNSEANSQIVNDLPDIGTTEVYRLAKPILKIIKNKIDTALDKL